MGSKMKKQNKDWNEAIKNLLVKVQWGLVDVGWATDKVLSLFNQLLAQKEKEIKEKQEEINRLNRFITRAIGASHNGYVPCDYLKLGLSVKNEKTK